jgi:hypothetical protein
MDARHVVEKAFSQSQKCYHHCDQPATLRFLNSGEPLVACYACPTGYVSKVMVYGHRDVDKTMREFLANALGGRPLREDEVRTATRHPWDLAIRDFEMSVAYWTQNYRGSKSEDPHRPALFICSNCNSTYVKPLSMPGTMCPNCRS